MARNLFLTQLDSMRTSTRIMMTIRQTDSSRALSILSSLSNYIHCTEENAKVYLSSAQIASYVSNQIAQSYINTDVYACVRDETIESYRWPTIEANGGSAPVWWHRGAASTPLDIAYSTSKIVVVGNNKSFTTVSAQSIELKESGCLPDVCIVLPTHVHGEVSILYIIAPRDPLLDCGVTENLALLLQGLLDPMMKSHHRLLVTREITRTTRMGEIVRRREESLVRHAMNAMKQAMINSLRGEVKDAAMTSLALADISESCRCINAATGHLKKGLVEVWTQASRSLTSMLTSHIALDRSPMLFGLIASQHSGGGGGSTSEVTELGGDQASESSLRSSLGSKYLSLVRDILMGAQTEKMKGQSMFTMSKIDDGDGKRRELWMVPMRSVKKTLAVLVVHVSFDAAPSTQSSSSLLPAEKLSPPQAIVSHFAEMFAPVLYAATVVESHKVGSVFFIYFFAH